jgi:hypothetical protein
MLLLFAKIGKQFVPDLETLYNQISITTIVMKSNHGDTEITKVHGD